MQYQKHQIKQIKFKFYKVAVATRIRFSLLNVAFPGIFQHKLEIIPQPTSTQRTTHTLRFLLYTI